MSSPEKEFSQSESEENPEEFAAKSYYERLGVPPWAPLDEISRAFRDLSKKYHPDYGGDTRMFQYLSEAYSTLKDEDGRWRYDHYRVNGESKGNGSEQKQPEKAKRESNKETPEETASSEEDNEEKLDETHEAETPEDEDVMQEKTTRQEDAEDVDTERDGAQEREESEEDRVKAKEKERLDELYRDLGIHSENQEKAPMNEKAADTARERAPSVRSFEGHAYPLRQEVIEAMKNALSDVYDALPHKGSVSTREVMKLMRETEIGNIESREAKYAKKAMKKFARRVAWLYLHSLPRPDFISKGMEILEPLMAGDSLKKSFRESVRNNAENEEQERDVLREARRQERERAGTVYEVKPKSTPKSQSDKANEEDLKQAA